jgi:hypothetical protein
MRCALPTIGVASIKWVLAIVPAIGHLKMNYSSFPLKVQ